ncbi:MAG: hypothetical protein LBQ48_01120 [Oscillospiraceae bacterium]|jgi:hypothetical protein|nr:hypothetical protein [Oscillospiraceae bacterium]
MYDRFNKNKGKDRGLLPAVGSFALFAAVCVILFITSDAKDRAKQAGHTASAAYSGSFDGFSEDPGSYSPASSRRSLLTGPVSLPENSHYTASKMQMLSRFITEYEGKTADDNELFETFGLNQCLGFTKKILNECYGIFDNTTFGKTKYAITSPHYLQLDQIVYAGAALTKERFMGMFQKAQPGDIIQMRSTIQWHSALVLEVNDRGVVFFDAGYDESGDLEFTGKSDGYNRICRHLVLWEDFIKDFSAEDRGITLYQIV